MPRVTSHNDDSDDAPGLHVGARKKWSRSSALTNSGRHFTWVVYAFSDIRHLISQGLKRTTELLVDGDVSDMEDWTAKARQEYPVYNQLLGMCEGLEKQVTSAPTADAIQNLADQKLGSGEKIMAGHQWPIFIYLNNTFDPNDPWKGLHKSELLIKAFKHVFIAPSAVDLEGDVFSTKSGNAKLHGMHKATKASIVYIATQVRFALSSATHWSRGDKVVDSENFYNSLLTTLNDPVHNTRIINLLHFWDQKIFPYHVPEVTLIPVEGSPLDRINQMAVETQLNASALS
ncbi:hypothetical protein DXG01_003517 [Tephrocybe rancida]|nr:hypothetical protein DXG01_003517 [Tephrocybe rancida]